MYIYIYWGRWMLSLRGAWHMGNREVEEGMALGATGHGQREMEDLLKSF